jgi:hypothetical protein
VRLEFIEIAKQMEPLDAVILQKFGTPNTYSPNARDYMASALKVTSDDVEVTFDNLRRLGLLAATALINPTVTLKGRMFLRAVQD